MLNAAMNNLSSNAYPTGASFHPSRAFGPQHNLRLPGGALEAEFSNMMASERSSAGLGPSRRCASSSSLASGPFILSIDGLMYLRTSRYQCPERHGDEKCPR